MQQLSSCATYYGRDDMPGNQQSGATPAIYLDMIGGIAGDMFIAAMCDLQPELERRCLETVGRIAELPSDIKVEILDHKPGDNFGKQFHVRRGAQDESQHEHQHVGYVDALRIVRNSDISQTARDRAEDIFEHLARCEGKVHGVAIDAVVFHEIGGWDSIIDIVLSASIIDLFAAYNWKCGPVPLGRGTVECAHGSIPVPAPATAELLREFTVYQDQHQGERVTPTGAAILRHLQPEQLTCVPPSILQSFGSGYGSKRIAGLANVLRCYELYAEQEYPDETVAVIEFDIDDQSPEDLALGIEAIRNCQGALDVTQSTYLGKKGRMGSTIRVLAAWENRDDIATACLSATSTIGLRWYRAHRRVLQRQSATLMTGELTTRIKRVKRPDGESTAKVESDDLAMAGSSYGERERIRATALAAADESKPSRDSENA